MEATFLEYRFRLAILAAIVGLGFWAPWINDPDIGGHTTAIYWISRFVSHLLHLPRGFVSSVAIVLIALMAGAGAALRIWGTAWLPPYMFDNKTMTATMRAVEGPYLCLRQPMKMGTWLVLTASAFLMPIGGTFIAVGLFTLFLYRLMQRDEFYLTAELGARYREYSNTIPCLIPHLYFSRRTPTQKPLYGRAVLSEIGAIGVFLTVATISWNKDNRLMMIAVAVSYALGLISKLAMPQREYGGNLVE